MGAIENFTPLPGTEFACLRNKVASVCGILERLI